MTASCSAPPAQRPPVPQASSSAVPDGVGPHQAAPTTTDVKQKGRAETHMTLVMPRREYQMRRTDALWSSGKSGRTPAHTQKATGDCREKRAKQTNASTERE